VNDKLNKFIGLLYEKLRLFLSISFGIFLFILFFQPFPLGYFDYNNRLLFVAGFGAIIFLFLFIVRIALPWMVQKNINTDTITYIPPSLSGFIMLALSSVSFAFYLRYVGLAPVSFYIMAKIILICMAPAVNVWLYDKFKDLKLQIEMLILEKKIIQKQIEKYEDDNLNKTIEFISDNNTENLSLLVAEVVFIKSADNYVEIVYKEGENFKKKLVRNTLKNTELQIKPYSNFIRCHRICIVNLHYIEKLISNYGNNLITIRGYNEQIPVSRQYLLKLKEAL